MTAYRGATRVIILLLLGAALLVPNGLMLSAAIAIRQATQMASDAGDLPDRLAQLRFNLSSAELLGRDYRERPTAATLAEHDRAFAAFSNRLAAITAKAHTIEPIWIAELNQAAGFYRHATEDILAAVQSGDAVRANALSQGEVRRSFNVLRSGISTAIDVALAREGHFKGREAFIQTGLIIAMPVTLLLDGVLWTVFFLMTRASAKRERLARRREIEATVHSAKRFRALVRNTSDLILVTDADGRIKFQSANAASCWGYRENALIGRDLATLLEHADVAALRELLGRKRSVGEGTRTAEIRFRTQEGTHRYADLLVNNLLHDPDVLGIVATIRDIEERKTFESQLTRQAFFDNLTGLANRPLLHDRLAQSLARSTRRGRLTGLIFIDLDNFKLVNDSLGHEAGDKLLVQIAERLMASGRAEDTVARLGGDEFVVLLDQLGGEADARLLAGIIGCAFKRPFNIGDRSLNMTASIGVAYGDAATDTPASLLRNADIAVYRAKAEGKDGCIIFDASMQQNSLARLELENGLRTAIQDGQLRVHYQPVVDMPTRRVVEVEALVRWQHPTNGLLAPAEFIPIAEESGIIVPLGLWVLETSCLQALEWHRLCPDVEPISLSVNLSPRQFQHADLDTDVAKILKRTGFPPERLKLEITESVIMRDVERTITALTRLKALGVRLAIDDFGTGYSSLSYLKHLPLDVLKIDGSFIKGIGSSEEDLAIVRTIMSLARSLSLKVTGEGIETAEQAELLSGMQCELGQGFLYSKPLDGVGLTDLLTGLTTPACMMEHAAA